jgi:hypothetical protein
VRNLRVHPCFVLSFVFMLLASTGRVYAQAPAGRNSAAESDVERVLRTQQEAWNRHDLDGFMAGYWNSPDLTFFSGAKENHGWQATMDRYRAVYASPGHEMGKLEFSDLRIEMLGADSAFARAIHPGVPQVSRWLEDCARPYFGGGIRFSTDRAAYLLLFTRTCT